METQIFTDITYTWNGDGSCEKTVGKPYRMTWLPEPWIDDSGVEYEGIWQREAA